MAKEKYSIEEVHRWNKRDGGESDTHLKRAIGEVFYHGLNRLAVKDVRIMHLEESLDKAAAKEEATTHRK